MSPNRKAQTFLEWVMLVIVISSALVAMSCYIRQAMQGRIRDAADRLGDGYSPSHGSWESYATIDVWEDTMQQGTSYGRWASEYNSTTRTSAVETEETYNELSEHEQEKL